jgi:hypothetical protein
MPMVAEQNGHLFLTDQRFHDPRRRRGGGGFAIPLDNPRAKP